MGDDWFSAQVDVPIQVEFTPDDKLNIANMDPDAKLYAEFADDSEKYDTVDKKRKWMKEGRTEV